MKKIFAVLLLLSCINAFAGRPSIRPVENRTVVLTCGDSGQVVSIDGARFIETATGAQESLLVIGDNVERSDNFYLVLNPDGNSTLSPVTVLNADGSASLAPTAEDFARVNVLCTPVAAAE